MVDSRDIKYSSFVDGYQNTYSVTRVGNIYNNKSHKLLKSKLSKRGYWTIALYKNGITKEFKIHRLLALAFISNPENKPHINHINGVKSDNRLENLEWVTHAENMRHYFDKLETPIRKQRRVKDLINNKPSPLGRKLSERTKQLISLGNKNKIVSQETRDKLSRINTGKKHSKEIIEKIAEKHRKKVQYIDNYGKIHKFNSINEASNATNILAVNIGQCCNGIRKTAGKIKWSFIC